MKKIIIDTDPGHDDALALILLEKSRRFNIRAVTTVAGNSTIQNVTNNARYIIDLLESEIPIFSGNASPLKRKLIKADVHGKSGLAGADIRKKETLKGNAVEKIVEIVKKNPNQITILALGPLTNIAEAFQKNPEIIPLIKEIVIMGGAIEVPGNKNRVAEFNIFIDPEAADIVFKAKTPKTLIPLDACNQVFLSLKDFEKLKKVSFYKKLKKMMEYYVQGILSFEKIDKAMMYDPLTAYYLINKKAFTFKKMDVKIETESELTRGMTVADRRIWGEKNLNVKVALSADKESFKKDFFRILKKA